MLHLALATNILTAVGAAPHFERPNFPILSRWYPPGVQIALLPFGERALRHFIYLERPEGMALDDAAGFAAAQHAQPLTAGDAHVAAGPEEWRTVGHLYRGIEAGLANLCARYGEDAVFIGPARAQAVTDIFEWPELLAVTDLASASRAIETIVEQGEGARGDWIKSHFGTFVGILEDLLAEQAADPAFNPARPVEPAFVQLPPDVEAGTLIEDPTTAQVADLANGLYEAVLQVLSRYYIHHGETAAEFDTLARTASFLLPHHDAAWKIIKERLDALERACTSLGQQAGLGALAPLAGQLHSMSQDIGTHIPETAAQPQRAGTPADRDS